MALIKLLMSCRSINCYSIFFMILFFYLGKHIPTSTIEFVGHLVSDSKFKQCQNEINYLCETLETF